MKIELSDKQQEQLRLGTPVEIVVSEGQKPFVLLSSDQYDRVRHLLDKRSKHPDDVPISISPEMRRSQEAFWHDLADLLRHKTRKQQWAAYHENERICITHTDIEAYQECFRRGLKHGEFYVGRVKLDPDGVPPWGTLDAERSLFESRESNEHMPPAKMR